MLRPAHQVAHLNRREWLARTFSGAVAMTAATSLPSAWAAGGLEVEAISADISVISGGGGNVLACLTNEGPVLVDSGDPASVDALLATLDELFAAPVKAVFNSHWHPDQTGANSALGSAGAAIHAHEKTRLRLTHGYYLREEDRYAEPQPEPGVPTETFRTRGSTQIGGTPLEFGYLLEAHTDGDIFVNFPASNVVAVGDVLSPVSDPSFDWFGGGWLGGRLDAIALLLDLGNNDTRYVPSIGPVMNRAEVETELAVLHKLFEGMVEHVRLGETAEDMLTTGVLDGLDRTFDDPYRLLYDMHKGFWAHHNKLMPDIL